MARPHLHLQPATEADLSLIQQWLTQSHLPTEDLPQILHSLYLGVVNEALVGVSEALAGADKVVVGVGGIERHGNDGLLRSVAIASQFRQQGYGQLLCRQLIQKAQEEGIQALYLLTTTAEFFFPKLGFKPISRQAVPTLLQQTTEFSTLCPDSAVCLWLPLTADDADVTVIAD